MTHPANELLQLALGLPAEERLQLAESLLASVAPTGTLPFDAEWIAEAKRRAARIDSGEERLSTWPEVRDRARARLKESSGG